MTVNVTQLKNGITIVTEDMQHIQSLSLGAWFQTGSRSEREHEHGIAHMLEHMAFKGTNKRSAKQIAEEIEAVGGEINAATSIEHTGYFARALKEDQVLVVDILADIIQNSVLDEAEFKREQSVILQEIAASHDMPDDYIFDLFQQTAFSDQSLGRPILGTLESVSNMQIDDLRGFMDRNYRADQLIISAAGAIDHEALVDLISEKFDHLPKEDKPTDLQGEYTGGDILVKDDLEQVHCIIGFEGCSFQSNDFYASQVLAQVLGGGMSSRLFQVIREQNGLCYSIFSFQWSFSDAAVFGIHSATSQEHLSELIPLTLDQLTAVIDEVSEDEIARVRAQVRSHSLMSLESPTARATQLARQMMIWQRPISMEELSNQIQAVQVDDVKRVAQRIFKSKPTLALIGPSGSEFTSSSLQEYLR